MEIPKHNIANIEREELEQKLQQSHFKPMHSKNTIAKKNMSSTT